jgi:hypothetical protein
MDEPGINARDWLREQRIAQLRHALRRECETNNWGLDRVQILQRVLQYDRPRGMSLGELCEVIAGFKRAT